MRRTRKPLGAADGTHDNQASLGLHAAKVALTDAEQGARDRDCGYVWDHLLIARAQLSHAYAHLSSSSSGPAQEMFERQFLGLQNRLTHLRDTLGFQCTKRLGKRR